MSTPDPVLALPADVEQRVRSSFGRQGLMRLLGARMETVEAGRVSIVLPRRPEVGQQHGYVHAGATSSIVDSAGGYAGMTMMAPGSEVLTVEFKLNLLAPAAGDHLDAVGTVIRSGRTLTVCRLEVFAVTGEERSLVATGQQTLIRVDAPPSPRAAPFEAPAPPGVSAD